jgi:hypothetical protein
VQREADHREGSDSLKLASLVVLAMTVADRALLDSVEEEKSEENERDPARSRQFIRLGQKMEDGCAEDYPGAKGDPSMRRLVAPLKEKRDDSGNHSSEDDGEGQYGCVTLEHRFGG